MAINRPGLTVRNTDTMIVRSWGTLLPVFKQKMHRVSKNRFLLWGCLKKKSEPKGKTSAPNGVVYYTPCLRKDAI